MLADAVERRKRNDFFLELFFDFFGIGNFIIRTLFFFPYRDTQCGAKVFKREALEKIISLLGITNWAFDVDLLYLLKRNGFAIYLYLNLTICSIGNIYWV